MKSVILILVAVFYTTFFLHAQSGIGTTSPNTNAVLDVVSIDKGMLIPRIGLTAGMGSPSPLTAHIAGMLIYNTGTSGTAPNDVRPGFYFNDGSKWVRVGDAAAGDQTKDAWVDDASNTQVRLSALSNGNSRPAGTEFVVKDDGKVGIGVTAPSEVLDVNGKLKVRNIVTQTTNSQRKLRKVLIVDTSSDGTITEVSKLDMINVLRGAGVLVKQSANNNWNGINVGTHVRLTFMGRNSLFGSPNFSFEVIFRPGDGFFPISAYNCTITSISSTVLRVEFNSSNVYDFTFSASDPAVTGGSNFYDVVSSGPGWIQGTFESIPINY